VRFSADMNATTPVAVPSSYICCMDRFALKLPSSCLFLLTDPPFRTPVQSEEHRVERIFCSYPVPPLLLQVIILDRNLPIP